MPSDCLGPSEAASGQGITKQGLFMLPSMQFSSHSSSWGFSFNCASLLETVASLSGIDLISPAYCSNHSSFFSIEGDFHHLQISS